METNVNYTVVGGFVIILFTALVLGIIWLSSGFSFEMFSTYQLDMQESVSGLNTDAAVEYNGVNVGTVKSVELDDNNPHFVHILISIKDNTPITQGTVATLATRGITGLTYIALQDKGTDMRPLVKMKGQDYPVIKTAPSIFLRIDTALQQFSADFKAISKSLQLLLSEENQKSIRNTLYNLQEITGSLAENNKKLVSILDNTSRVTLQLEPLVVSSTGTMRMLETQTLPATYRLLSNLDNVTRALAEVAEELKQNPSILIRGINRQGTLGPGEKR